MLGAGYWMLDAELTIVSPPFSARRGVRVPVVFSLKFKPTGTKTGWLIFYRVAGGWRSVYR
jgi:hypothetical protein